jgi:hypothetical protein
MHLMRQVYQTYQMYQKEAKLPCLNRQGRLGLMEAGEVMRKPLIGRSHSQHKHILCWDSQCEGIGLPGERLFA